MGTRSTLHITEEDGTHLASVYRQMDGYPTSMGNDIKTLLNNGNVELRNGFSRGDKIPHQFNGMMCLGAFLIGALKGVNSDIEEFSYKGATANIGKIYLTTKKDRQAYDYFLTQVGNGVNLKVKTGRKTLFDGPLSEFDGEKAEAKE